ncbi:MAG TPA: dihydrofolate reductase [Bacteroidales bacterium]|jgi:dipeptidyl-peptidase-3|nr:dihydrofolate reductase [Bacteroidales bacterium]MBK7731402.1 dihydrofolate reductase [Bacteroidales bacterium]MBP7035225.1 dihydrofolate reductase [Bacteroidales bacterium]MBP8708603.1 dihydrofolate reductase [Bacteroidales bacterium]MZQ79063.1 dihydrofolate reductase [Bacteroidales bacterium]
MKNYLLIATILFMGTALLTSCGEAGKKAAPEAEFKYEVDRFEDISVLKYRLPAFEQLTTGEKEFIYYLSEAALCGRDILWDQNFKYNLLIRKTIEAIIDTYDGDRESDDYKAFITYARRVFFANGIHHHYSNDKFVPGFSADYFALLVSGSDADRLPLKEGESADDLTSMLTPVLFDPALYARRVDQTEGVDMVTASANNFYEGVTQAEVEQYYASLADPADPRPVSWGLNSKVMKVDGKVTEIPWKSGGLYGQAIDKIVYWLEKARDVALSETQKNELDLLISYYRSGDLKTWDEYNVVWAGNTELSVDYINGFIETYGDPMGMKATWEAVVDYKDSEASKRTALITENAQWFEDHSPVDPQYRKEKVTGVAASVINVAMLGGDCYPASPLGINLPNSNWIRAEAGSKSVTLANITDAKDIVSRGSGFLEEFAFDQAEIDRIVTYGSISDALHTDMHECIGHASGKLAPGTDPNALKNYASPLEEMRADLFALYFMMDPKMTEIGLMPSDEPARALYDGYIRNGFLTQIVRIQPGKDIEQAHMRCRSAIAHWVYEKGRPENVIEVVKRDSKTFVRINDYQKLRGLFGEMLREVQRIKSEGDFEAGRSMIENYGVKIDQELHGEILARYAGLNLAPYSGFVNPVMTPVTDRKGRITDVKIEYCSDFLGQMMEYGKKYSFLPVW